MTGESAAVLAMRQLVREASAAPAGLPRSRRNALERLTALAERRAARQRPRPVAPAQPNV